MAAQIISTAPPTAIPMIASKGRGFDDELGRVVGLFGIGVGEMLLHE